MVEKTFRVRKGLDVEGPDKDASIINGVLTLGTIGNISGSSSSILAINSLGSVNINLDTNANDTASVFRIKEDNTDFFVMDNDGQVGIGTSSPSALLDVDGDATVSGNLSLDGSNKELRFYEGSNYVGFEAPALSADQIWVLPAADGSANQALTTDGSGNFQWTSAGSIAGVGSNLSLANGTNNRIVTAVDGSNINGEANLTFDGSVLALAGDLNVGSGDFFVDDSSGRVGIGTTSPGNILDVEESVNGSAQIRIENKNSGGDANAATVGIVADGNHLTVASYGDSHASLANYNRITTGASSAVISIDSGTVGEGILVADGGNVGIGVTAPTDTLAVRGGIKIGEFNDTDGTGYGGSAAPSSANLGTGASDPQIRVSGRSTGNPGIIQMAQFDANNFFGGTTEFVLGRLQFAMNENSQEVTTVAEIRGITSNPNVPGHFDGALEFFTSQGDASGANLTEKMVITADGNVGIGTTSPASQLDISSASTSTLRLSNSDGGLTEDQITGEIIFYQDDDSGSADGITGRIGMRSAKRLDGTNYYGDVGDMGFFVAGSGNFTANTNAALEAMTIRAGGKVGIGTTAPEYKLDVQSGSIRILPTISSNAGTAIRIGAGGNSNDITLLRIDGESSNNSGESDSGQYGFSMKYMGSGSGTGNRYAMFMDNQAGTAIEAMSILQDGKVGIGTESPTYELDVAGNIGVDNIIYHNGDGNTYLNFQDDDFRIVVGNDLAFHYDEGSASKLHLSYNGEADVEIGNAGATPDFFFGGSQGSYNGKMGIGTITPSSTLDVVGTIECTGLKLQDGTLDYGTGKQQSEGLAVGWYTVAYVAGRDAVGSYQRAFGEFLINCNKSSRHGTVRFNATHFFGAGESIQALAYNFYSTPSFSKLRIKSGGVYSGAAIQLYVSNSSNDLESYMTMTEHSNSWVLLDTWLLDTESGGAHDALMGYSTDAWANFAVAEELDLSVFNANSQGGIYTTGGLKAEEIRLGKAATNSYLYLSPDTDNSFILASSSGTDVTLAADDDLVLHADDAIIFQTEGSTKFGMHNGRFGIGVNVATTTTYPLGIESADGLAINQGTNDARQKRIFATTSNDGSPWDEMVYYSRGSVGGWSGQHTFMVDKNGESAETGYEALRIRDSGDGSNSIVAVTHKLGVGTSTPSSLLHIHGDMADAKQGILITRDDTSTVESNMLGGIGFDSNDGNIPSKITEASVALIGYASEDHGTLDKGGYLSVLLTETNDNDDTTSTEVMRVSTVSAGTSSTLTLKNGNFSMPADTKYAAIDFHNADASGAGVGASINAMTSTSGRGGYLEFQTGTTVGAVSTKLTINEDGIVGIGTTSPSLASGIGLEVSHATQANLRVTDSSASASSDFAQSENDLYIVNRKSGGNIRMRVGGSTETILMDSDGDIKFANGATSSWATWNSVVYSRKTYNNLIGSGAALYVEYDGTGTLNAHLIPFTAKIRAIAFHINGTAGVTVDDDSTTNQTWNFFKGGDTSDSFTTVTFNNDANLTRQGTTNHWYYLVTGLNISVAAGETLHVRRDSGSVSVGNVRIEVFYSHV